MHMPENKRLTIVPVTRRLPDFILTQPKTLFAIILTGTCTGVCRYMASTPYSLSLTSNRVSNNLLT